MTNVVVLEPFLQNAAKRQSIKAEATEEPSATGPLSPHQRAYLKRGLEQPGGKLPLFDRNGQRYSAQTIRSCLDQGWAKPWFRNPLQPHWLVCKLTDEGRKLAKSA